MKVCTLLPSWELPEHLLRCLASRPTPSRTWCQWLIEMVASGISHGKRLSQTRNRCSPGHEPHRCSQHGILFLNDVPFRPVWLDDQVDQVVLLKLRRVLRAAQLQHDTPPTGTAAWNRCMQANFGCRRRCHKERCCMLANAGPSWAQLDLIVRCLIRGGVWGPTSANRPRAAPYCANRAVSRLRSAEST